MNRHRVTSSHPVDLASGRVAAPGDIVDADPKAAHDAALIAAGHLTPAPPRPQTSTTPPRRTSATKKQHTKKKETA